MREPINEVKRTLCILLSHEKGRYACAWKHGSTTPEGIRKLPTRCEEHKCRGAFNEIPMLEELGCFTHYVDVDMLTHHGCAARDSKERGGCPI